MRLWISWQKRASGTGRFFRWDLPDLGIRRISLFHVRGNPYFIDLETLIKEGVLTKKECEACDFGKDPETVDYGKLYEERYALLRKAYERSNVGENHAFHEFQEKERYWLRDYAIFMAVKKRFGDEPWNEWAEDIRFRLPNAMEYYQRELYFDIEFHEYMQYLFQRQ